MKKKQLLGILLAGTMMVGAAVPVLAEDGDRVKITYAQWGNETETAATQAVADKFNSEQDKIEVEVVKIDHDTYVTKLNAMATAGELPDTGIMSEAGVLKFAENGLLADISSMYGEGDAKPLDCLTFRYDGTPVAYSAANEVLNLWYNNDLLKEVCEKQGIDPSEVTPPADAENAWDWDTFVETAQKLTLDINGKNALDPDFDPENIDVYGVNISKWWAGYMPFLFSEGGDYLTEDGTSIGYATDEGKDVLQKLADLIYVYHVAPTPTASETMPGLSEALATNKVAMSFDGQWSNAGLMSDGVEYNVAALPRMGETPATVATYGAIALMNSEKIDAAFEFVKYIMTEVGACEPLFKSGLWLPTNMKEYNDDYIKTIITENHPANYYDSIVTPMMDGTARTPITAYVKNFNKINDVISPALDDLWSGEKTADEAISSIEADANAQVQGFYGK